MKSFSLALVLVFGLTLAGCNRNPFTGMYSATAEIQIRFGRLIDVSGFGRGDRPDESPTQIASEIEIMQSNDVLVPIILKLKLDQIWAKRFKSDHDVLTLQEALDHLRKVLKIERVSGATIIKVIAYSEVPQETAEIANALIDSYKAMRDQEEAEHNKRGLDSLRDQITQQQKVVADKKAAVEKMSQSMSDEDNQQRPDVPSLRAECAKIESAIDKLLKDGFKEDHPRIISLRKELAMRRQQLKTLSAPTLADDMDQIQQLDRDLKQQQSLLDALNVRLKQLIADEALQESPVRIVSRAVPPPE